jgi:hypothetical protein
VPESLNPLIDKCPSDPVQANAYLAGVIVGMRLERYAPEKAAKTELDLLTRHVLRMKREGDQDNDHV